MPSHVEIFEAVSAKVGKDNMVVLKQLNTFYAQLVDKYPPHSLIDEDDVATFITEQAKPVGDGISLLETLFEANAQKITKYFREAIANQRGALSSGGATNTAPSNPNNNNTQTAPQQPDLNNDNRPPGSQGKKRGRDSFEKDAVAYAKRFQADIKNVTIASTIGQYTALPIFKLLASTSRTRFPVAADTVDLMHREVTTGLEKFLKDNRGQPAVYIHGPQGVGKSFSLYEIVCRFRSQANTRVVYIPDCGGWGALMQEESADEAVSFLLYAILLAFPDDASIEQLCLDCELEQQSVVALLKHLPIYCEKNGLELFAVFDQHNSLKPELRTKFPFSVVESLLPYLADWKLNKALVVVSASANNSYFLKVAADERWPDFPMSKCFSESEFDAWVVKEGFFVGLDHDSVKHWTSLVPLELRILGDTYKKMKHANPLLSLTQDALKKVLDQYTNDRERTLFEQQQKFESEYFKAPEDKDAHIRAVVWMSLGISGNTDKGAAKLLNLQLMYVDDGVVKPTTPLARRLLLSRHNKEFETIFNTTASQVFKASLDEFTADAKGRTYERYVIRQLEAEKSIHVKAAVIDTTKPPAAWATVAIDISNCQVIHFLGNKTNASVAWNSSAMIVPDNPNYPDVDVMIFDPSRGLFVAAQFTVTAPLKHSRNFFELKDGGVLSDLWKLKSKGGIKLIRMLWVTVTKDIKDAKFNGDLVITAAELEGQFSELRGFVI
jgi:hypothetical protein